VIAVIVVLAVALLFVSSGRLTLPFMSQAPSSSAVAHALKQYMTQHPEYGYRPNEGVSCRRSHALDQVKQFSVGSTGRYNCTVTQTDGTTREMCVLSRHSKPFAMGLPVSCEATARDPRYH